MVSVYIDRLQQSHTIEKLTKSQGNLCEPRLKNNPHIWIRLLDTLLHSIAAPNSLIYLWNTEICLDLRERSTYPLFSNSTMYIVHLCTVAADILWNYSLRTSINLNSIGRLIYVSNLECTVPSIGVATLFATLFLTDLTHWIRTEVISSGVYLKIQ